MEKTLANHPEPPDFVAATLLEASEWILEQRPPS
jgi:hypothetical protein